MKLYRIKANHFVAGIIAEGNKIVEAAPILAWTIRKKWSVSKLKWYCTKIKKWEIEEL